MSTAMPMKRMGVTLPCCVLSCWVSLLAPNTTSAQENFEEKSRRVQAFLLDGKFDDAEPLVRECLEEAPKDISLLSQLDQVLNGQRKYAEADLVRDRIRMIWKKEHERNWRKKGAPVGEATWARMIVSSRDYHVIGTEYFTPEVLRPEPTITTFYKVIALSKMEGRIARLFKLEMSDIVGKFYVLREDWGSGGRQIIPYGESMPDIRQVVADAVDYLDSNQ